MVCCFFFAAMPDATPAAQLLSREGLIKKNIAGLQEKLEAAAAGDSTPLHALTIQFLEDLQKYGFKKDTTHLQRAVTQYVADVQEQSAAADLNVGCAAALAYSIYVNGTSMISEAVSGGAPACQAISLSMSAASIISSFDSYQICVDPTKQPDLAPQLKALQYYSFIADVLGVTFCTPTPSAQVYITLLYNFIEIFLIQS